jgi:hypothetical protein
VKRCFNGEVNEFGEVKTASEIFVLQPPAAATSPLKHRFT